jgi:hypothetical protein
VDVGRRVLRHLFLLKLSSQSSPSPIAQARQEQSKVGDPHQGAECDACNLQAPYVVKRRLTLSSKDVERVADEQS